MPVSNDGLHQLVVVYGSLPRVLKFAAPACWLRPCNYRTFLCSGAEL